MKRIGIDIREFKNGKMTGIGRFLKDLIFVLKDMKDFEFILFSNQYTKINFNLPENFKIIKINESFTFFYDQISLPFYLKREKIDIFISVYHKLPLFSKTFKINIIFDLTNFIYKEYKLKLKNKILYFLEKIFLKKSNLILTTSENTKKDILNLFKINDEKIKVIYPYISDNFKKIKEEKKLNLIKDKINNKFILYVGNSNLHKNLKTLVDVYESLPLNLRKEYSLVLIGVKKEKIRTKENIYIYEEINDEELIVFYSLANIFVFPSFYEGFGYPPMEALKCQCPVLSSNASCLKEILKNYVVYFDPYNKDELYEKLIDILNDKDFIYKFSKLDFYELSKYKKENFYKNIFEILKDIEVN